MKKISILFVAAASMVLVSCGGGTFGAAGSDSNSQAAAANQAGGILGGVVSAITNGSSVGNVIQSVLGLDKITKENLIGTWTYNQLDVHLLLSSCWLRPVVRLLLLISSRV